MLQPATSTRNKHLTTWRSFMVILDIISSPPSISTFITPVQQPQPFPPRSARSMPPVQSRAPVPATTSRRFRRIRNFHPKSHVLREDLEIQWFSWKKCCSDDSFFEVTIIVITNLYLYASQFRREGVISQVKNKCFAFSRGGRPDIYTTQLDSLWRYVFEQRRSSKNRQVPFGTWSCPTSQWLPGCLYPRHMFKFKGTSNHSWHQRIKYKSRFTTSGDCH